MTDKPKFKQTEVGLIPSDWEVKSFGELFNMCTANISIKDVNQEFYVGTENMLQNKMGVVKNTAVLPYSKVREYQKNDILVSNIRPYLKKIWFADKNGGCSTDVLVFRVKDKNQSPSFLYNVVADDRFFNIVNENAIGTKMPRGDKNVIKQILFAVPSSKAEQTAIANALSDVDTLIANLEKLIAKKKNIKQGAMQQLLTGKKRLPGFASDERQKECHSERSAKREVEESNGYKMTELGMIPSDWECVSFNKVFVKLNSRNYQVNSDEYLVIGKYPVIDQGQEPIAAYTNKSNPMKVSSSGIIVFGDHTRIFKYVNFDFFVGADGTQLITCLDGLNTKFLFFQCLCLDIPNTGYNRHFKYLKESLFVIPSSIEEQTAIANVLSDMDAEISALETKLAKYRTLKTGMMQQLLTGKIRLV